MNPDIFVLKNSMQRREFHELVGIHQVAAWIK